MSDNSQTPRNRRERRAALANSKSRPSTFTELPLSQPSRDPPKHKTLYDLAAERQAELRHGQPFAPDVGRTEGEPATTNTTINPDGTLSFSGSPQDVDEPIGPFGEAFFFALTLTMLHFTLDVLVHHQYRQEIGWSMIAQRAAITFPIMTALIYFFYGRTKTFWVQAIFLLSSVSAGCYLIHSSNKEPYFAVMKRAPPLGTLWVWSVIEMRLEVAVTSLVVVGLYFWRGGFTIF